MFQDFSFKPWKALVVRNRCHDQLGFRDAATELLNGRACVDGLIFVSLNT